MAASVVFPPACRTCLPAARFRQHHHWQGYRRAHDHPKQPDAGGIVALLVVVQHPLPVHFEVGQRSNDEFSMERSEPYVSGAAGLAGGPLPVRSRRSGHRARPLLSVWIPAPSTDIGCVRANNEDAARVLRQPGADDGATLIAVATAWATTTPVRSPSPSKSSKPVLTTSSPVPPGNSRPSAPRPASAAHRAHYK